MSEDRKLTICFDLDGTLLEFDGWRGFRHFGEVKPAAVKFIKELTRPGGLSGDGPGWRILINTCRMITAMTYPALLNHLADAGVPIGAIEDINAYTADEQGYRTWISNPRETSGKPVADVYVDDRSHDSLVYSGGKGNSIDWKSVRQACELMEVHGGL